MHVLRIEVEFDTGKRAGGINPKDRNLPCRPDWQDTEQGIEFRLVRDGDVAKYRNVPGVTVLSDETEIDSELQKLERTNYSIGSEYLMVESLKQKNIDISDLPPTLQGAALAKELYERGALGISKMERRPLKAKEMARKHEKKEKVK